MQLPPNSQYYNDNIAPVLVSISEYTDIAIESIKNKKNRIEPVLKARYIAIYLLVCDQIPFTTISKLFNITNNGINYALEKVRGFHDKDLQLKNSITNYYVTGEK